MSTQEEVDKHVQGENKLAINNNLVSYSTSNQHYSQFRVEMSNKPQGLQADKENVENIDIT